MSDKLKDIASLKEILNQKKKDGKRCVFTNGCFDIIHKGHITLLNEARSRGDLLVVAINSDESIRKLKGKGRPIFSQKERAGVLSCFDCVDYIVVFDEDIPDKIIKQLSPNVLVKGGDYKKEESVGADFVESLGGEVVIVPEVKGCSTSEVIERIKKLK